MTANGCKLVKEATAAESNVYLITDHLDKMAAAARADSDHAAHDQFTKMADELLAFKDRITQAVGSYLETSKQAH